MKDGTLNEALRGLGAALTATAAAEIPEALAELERLKAVAWLRIRLPEPAPAGDRLLTAKEAAPRLGVTVKAMYRRRWPFRKDHSSGNVRFSEQGIERYIASLGKTVARSPSLR